MGYKTYEEQEDGWTVWVRPPKFPKYFKMSCCDCGLVHNIQFEKDETKEQRIIFRVQRNNRATANVRRGKTFKNG